MVESFCKSQAHPIVCLEELVGEMLSEKSKHQICPLGVWSEFPPQHEFLHQQLRVWKFHFPWREKKYQLLQLCMQQG